MNIGKIPPQAIDIEEVILGTILSFNVFPTIVELKVDMFYKETNQIVFRAIETLKTANKVIDIITVANELQKRGQLEAVNGTFYITGIANRVVSSANLNDHAAILCQKWMQRELIAISAINHDAAYDETNDIFELLEKTEEKISNLRNFGAQKDGFTRISKADRKKLLQTGRINTANSITEPQTILEIKETTYFETVYKRICTLGNFSMWIGQAKSKKTFLISMLTGSLINGRDSTDTIIGKLPIDKNMVAYFDTEQGLYDSINVIRRIERIAGTRKNLYSYNLREFCPKDRVLFIQDYCAEFGYKTAFLVIDGIADLVEDFNDVKEATAIGTMILNLTKVYNIHFAVILHQNKTDGKAMGHVGSYLLRKAESVVSVAGDSQNKNISHVHQDLMRGGAMFNDFSFEINSDGMPVITEFKKVETNKNEKVPY